MLLDKNELSELKELFTQSKLRTLTKSELTRVCQLVLKAKGENV